METVVLTPRFEEDYDEKRIEFVDSNNNIVCIGFFVPFQFVIHPWFNSFESYDTDNKFNSISGYSHSTDEMLIMDINITNDTNFKYTHNIRKQIFYYIIQDAIRDYTLRAFEEGINVIIENGYNDRTEIMENSSIYRYVRYYYSTLLNKTTPTVYKTKNTNKEDKKNIKYSERKDSLETFPNNFTEFEEEDNPAYTKADDPEKGLNYIYD